MKPAEIVTVAIAIPVVAAFLVGQAAESKTASMAPAVRTAQVEAPAPTFFDEIVVTAKRPTSKG